MATRIDGALVLGSGGRRRDRQHGVGNPLRIYETIRNREAVVPWFSNGRTRHRDWATELVTACAVVGGRTRLSCLCLFVHGIGSGVVCVERAVLQV